jgi:hypothetical protein
MENASSWRRRLIAAAGAFTFMLASGPGYGCRADRNRHSERLVSEQQPDHIAP